MGRTEQLSLNAEMLKKNPLWVKFNLSEEGDG